MCRTSVPISTTIPFIHSTTSTTSAWRPLATHRQPASTAPVRETEHYRWLTTTISMNDDWIISWIIRFSHEWRGVGVVICRERGADCLHMVQLMPLDPETPSSLASFKSRLVLPFWYRLTLVVLEKRPLNGCSSSSRNYYVQSIIWCLS